MKGLRMGDGDVVIRPWYGDVRQLVTIYKGILSDRGDALREGDAWQHLETREGILPDLVDALCKG